MIRVRAPVRRQVKKMDSNSFERSDSFLSGTDVTENADNLFRLYSQLIQPLKNYEGLCNKQETLNKEIQEAKNTIRTAFIKPILLALKYTVTYAIAFALLFLLITNMFRTSDGVLLFTAYDHWFEETAFGAWLLAKLSLMNSSSALSMLFGIVLMLVVGCIVFPIVAVLFPAMLVTGIVVTIISVLSAKSTIKNGSGELEQLDQQIKDMLNELAEPLIFVPPDYRYSAAVEHFWQSYNNGSASTLKEAIILFDNASVGDEIGKR